LDEGAQGESAINVLFLDTETSPNQVDTWGLRDQNIAINQIRKPGALLCWGAKWQGRPDEEVIFDSVRESTRLQMVKHLHSLISDADVIVGYNNINFDMKVINREFVLAGLPPPPPVKQIDLLRVMRRNFRFASNKLDYVSQQLGLGKKTAHMGHALWTMCEQGDADAWALMTKYNKQDVLLTEKLYDRVLPWIGAQHPNRNNYPGHPEIRGCHACGSVHLQQRGERITVAQRYIRYQCQDCGTWGSSAFQKLNTREDRERIIRAA
jgi:DNA polymerase elongation subunit (family B)